MNSRRDFSIQFKFEREDESASPEFLALSVRASSVHDALAWFARQIGNESYDNITELKVMSVKVSEECEKEKFVD